MDKKVIILGIITLIMFVIGCSSENVTGKGYFPGNELDKVIDGIGDDGIVRLNDDDGLRDPAPANPTPTDPVCGDGVIEGGEQCDDGNTNPGDLCSATCIIEECGNGVQDPMELCDDGNLVDGDGCNQYCTIEICGDGTIQDNEQCDDHNQLPNDVA